MTINDYVTLITYQGEREGRRMTNFKGDSKHSRFQEEKEMGREWKAGRSHTLPQYNLDTPKEPLTQYYSDPMAKYPPPLQPLM